MYGRLDSWMDGWMDVGKLRAVVGYLLIYMDGDFDAY